MQPGKLAIAEFAFPGPLRDQLVAAIVSGAKTTTTGLMADYQHEGEPLPRVGDRQVVVDSAGNPVTVIETVAVRVLRLADIDLAHATAEGEGYTSVAQWRAGHEGFWHSDQLREALEDPGFTVDDDTLVVAQEFRVVGREHRQENKDLVVRLIDEVWNGGNLGLLPELWAGPSRDEASGRHEILTGAFPDLRIDIDDLVAEGDRVVARLSFRGTHQGPFRDIAPTGRQVRFTAIRIYQVADGKITGTWANQDALGLLQQLRALYGQPPRVQRLVVRQVVIEVRAEHRVPLDVQAAPGTRAGGEPAAGRHVRMPPVRQLPLRQFAR
jgi:uncharacterized protein YhfF